MSTLAAVKDCEGNSSRREFGVSLWGKEKARGSQS